VAYRGAQATCSSERTLSHPAPSPVSGLDSAQLLVAGRGRRTLEAWQLWRPVLLCHGGRKGTESARSTDRRAPATCVSVLGLQREA
jgi:hypothetical protein